LYVDCPRCCWLKGYVYVVVRYVYVCYPFVVYLRCLCWTPVVVGLQLFGYLVVVVVVVTLVVTLVGFYVVVGLPVTLFTLLFGLLLPHVTLDCCLRLLLVTRWITHLLVTFVTFGCIYITLPVVVVTDYCYVVVTFTLLVVVGYCRCCCWLLLLICCYVAVDLFVVCWVQLRCYVTLPLLFYLFTLLLCMPFTLLLLVG